MQYILLILSLILYIAAPSDMYNLSFCIQSLVIFIFGAIWGFMKMKSIEIFGFNLLFTISFFGCCYIFPIFIYNIDATYSLFHHGYDPTVMTKCTCMASLAYSCYLCGLLKNFNRLKLYNTMHSDEPIQIYSSVKPEIVFRLSVLFFVLFIIAGGYKYLEQQYSEGILEKGIITYFYVFITLIPILLSYALNYSFKKKYVLMSLCFVVIFLITGSRTFPVALLVGIFYVYNMKRKVSISTIIILLLVGIIGMSVIGMLRGGDAEAATNIGYWNIFLDLIVNNRNLFDAYSIVQEKGLVPTVLLGPILAAIPMGQSFFVALTNIPNEEMRSSLYLTVERLGSNPSVGLGTNIVGDVYLGGGIIAVFILFFLLGYFVSKSLYMIIAKKNLVWFVFYLSMVTNAIFICRGSFFGFVRPFIWTIMIMLFIKLFSKRNII